ncbi:ribokinase [Palleronia marisminoris]|uniref:ribokinase n=1 Tax=Palleronia marisminoris TaxID=315423 RepID=UPI0008F2B117|nr:ribokinase [Palleronia marisminoris]SFH26729.1 ribokinase [Palleronia marisminoris]
MSTSPPDRPVVLSLGSINADFQMRIDKRPEVSETLLAHDFVRAGGGKAANVAFLARKLGRDPVLLGRVGDDDLAEQALAPLREIGIDLRHVDQVQGADTAVSVITVPPDGKKAIVLAPGANDAWEQEDTGRPDEVVSAAPKGSILVIDCEVPEFVARAAAQSARRRGLFILLDPSPADRVSDELLSLVDVVVPNPTEAETLTGIAVDGPDGAVRAGRAFLDRGCKVACMKLPDGGCIVAQDKEDFRHVTVEEVDIVDTTGAGDAFAGAMAVALSEGHDAVAAAIFATAASTHAVTGYGSQPAYPGRDDIEKISATITTSKLRE